MEGYELNEVCNRDGCKGIIEEKDIDGGCSCHINPPCSYCETPKEYCPECGWDAQEALAEIDYENQKHVEPFKIETSEERELRLEKRYSEDDGNLYRINRYFDNHYEACEAKDIKLGDAYKKLDQLNSKDRYYVSYQIKKQ